MQVQRARSSSPVKLNKILKQGSPFVIVRVTGTDYCLFRLFVIAHGSQEEFSGKTNKARRLRRFRRETKKEWLLRGIHLAIKNAIAVNMDNVKLWNDDINAVEDAESLVMLNRQKNKILNNSPRNGFYWRVYVDGACTDSGRPNAKAGIGVWFGHDHPWYISLLLSF